MKKIISSVLCFFLLLICFSGCNTSISLKYNMETLIKSKDAYVKIDTKNSCFELGTDKVKQVIIADKNGLRNKSLYNKESNEEYIVSGENKSFEIILDDVKYDSQKLKLSKKSFNVKVGNHSEIIFSLYLTSSKLNVDYVYTIYPGTSIIKSTYSLTNNTKKMISVKNPTFLDFCGIKDTNETIKLIYFTGGGNFTGSQEKKEYAMYNGYEKTMLSYDEREVSVNSKGFYDSTQDQWNGYSGYEPCFIFQNAKSGNGIFFGFEYAGLWESVITKNEDVSLMVGLTLFEYSLNPNQSISVPSSFSGVFTSNLDNATNDLLFYQYEYEWDNVGSLYPLCSTDTWSSLSRISFDNIVGLIEQSRYLGLDLVHIDDNMNGVGWYDKKMDWNPCFEIDKLSDYIHASGAKSSLWAPTQHYDYTSTAYAENPGLEIPDFDSGFYGPLLCVGNDTTIDFMEKTIKRIIKDNKIDMVKMDGWIMSPCEDSSHTHNVFNNGYSATYYQYYNYLKYLQYAIDSAENDFSWILCASGGELHGFDFMKYATYVTTTDGASQNPVYNLSYLFPSGKFQSGYASVKNYNVANTRTYGFTGGICTTLDPLDSSIEYTENLEKMRKDIAIFRYLRNQGVLGRYSKQYHLTTSVLGQSLYMKTDRYSDKAVIFGITENYDKKIYPIGLDKNKTYTVSFYNNKNFYTDTGENLINNGISLEGVKQGEIIFFNMLNTPDSGRDKFAPIFTDKAIKKVATYINRIGVEIDWENAYDENFIDCYEIYKNGVLIDKVSKGTFYFDKIGNINDDYKIVAVDGDNNKSITITAKAGEL